MVRKAWLVFVASVLLVYATISLGAVTRAMGAGMGCGPEWPLCLGYIVPPSVLNELEVFLEYSHRLVAFSAFIAVLLSLVLAWTSNPASKPLRLWATVTFLAMVAQVLLGAIVVILHLDPLVSALHAILAVLVVITATIAMVEARYYYR